MPLRRGWPFPALWLAVALLALAACDRPSSLGSPLEAPRAGAAARGRDLARDEQEGGHTLARHVGRSAGELAARLAGDPRLRSASSFPDRATAERAVAATLESQRDRIERWVERGPRRPNLALTVRSPDGRPFGLTLSQGERSPRPAFAVRVVLRARGPGFYVLTAYPTEER